MLQGKGELEVPRIWRSKQKMRKDMCRIERIIDVGKDLLRDKTGDV